MKTLSQYRLPALLAAGAALICLSFHQEIAAAISIWNSSTAYGHCWLVLPICAWLLWERKDVLQTIPAKPTLWPILPAIPLAACWVAADWLGIMEGRQLALVAFLQLLLLAGLGWRLFWALSPALLYLFFAVPFGAFITPQLQSFTANFIIEGLKLLNIPYEADAMRITIPEGAFYVAEACAGLRFLIASIAFGVLYAVTMFRSPWRRAIFIAISCIVPIIANGFRGLGIVLLGHILGSAEAGAADHIIYGWVFFSVVILLLAFIGFGFRQAPKPFLRSTTQIIPPKLPPILLACLPIALLGAATPFLAPALERQTNVHLTPQRFPIILPDGCRTAGSSAIGATTKQFFFCGNQQVIVTTTTLPPGSNPARILDAGRSAAMENIGTDVDSEPWRTQTGAPWILLTAHDTGRAAAYMVLDHGTQIIGGLHERLLMAQEVFHPGAPPIAVAITIAPGNLAPDQLIRDFLTAQKTP